MPALLYMVLSNIRNVVEYVTPFGSLNFSETQENRGFRAVSEVSDLEKRSLVFGMHWGLEARSRSLNLGLGMDAARLLFGRDVGVFGPNLLPITRLVEIVGVSFFSGLDPKVRLPIPKVAMEASNLKSDIEGAVLRGRKRVARLVFRRIFGQGCSSLPLPMICLTSMQLLFCSGVGHFAGVIGRPPLDRLDAPSLEAPSFFEATVGRYLMPIEHVAQKQGTKPCLCQLIP